MSVKEATPFAHTVLIVWYVYMYTCISISERLFLLVNGRPIVARPKNTPDCCPIVAR